MPVIIDPKGEYVVDTSVLYSSIEGYADEMMKDGSRMTYNELINARDVCFNVVSSLENSSIAVDNEDIIIEEYEKKVFNKYPNEYPTQWFNQLVAKGNIKEKQTTLVGKNKLKEFNKRQIEDDKLSRADCQFVFTTSLTNKKILFHRDNDYSNASDFIKIHYKVVQVHVLRK